MDQFKKFCILLVIVMLGTVSCISRKPDQTSVPVQDLINSQNYVFKADYAQPLGGRQLLITGPYEVQITKSTVIANLPYFGVSQRAPMGADETGIKFTSSDFNYDIQPKKNGWQIQVRPNDNREVRVLNLRVTASGKATLQVTSNFKQSISYSGQIIKAEDRRK